MRQATRCHCCCQAGSRLDATLEQEDPRLDPATVAAARGAQAASGGEVAVGPDSEVAGEDVEVHKVDAAPPGVTTEGGTGRWDAGQLLGMCDPYTACSKPFLSGMLHG